MVLDSEKPKTMETYLRGFSFMPEKPLKKDEVKLQYIEGEELERTWRTTRRQRLKEREQKIWDNFVKEELDVVGSVCRDDPYQFLEQLPEACLKEFMEMELQKMRNETAIEVLEQDVQQQEQKGDGDSPLAEETVVAVPVQPTVTFSEEVDEDANIIYIFDDDKEEDQSAPDAETANDSPSSPCTVRENYETEKELSLDSPPSPGKGSCKSSENVTFMIESSIYCAKVKDLRAKINDEIVATTLSLKRLDVMGIDPEELAKMSRRSIEFCARFNRNYMYQLHRQIHLVKRNNNAALPFARHTQFQSQMVRIVSLHQNLLQSLQMFHKSFEQTGCVRESADTLRALAQLARDACAACAAAPAPGHLACARDLYDDEVLTSCNKLEEVISEFSAKLTSYTNSTANTTAARSKKGKSNGGRKSGTWSKSGSKIKSDAGEARLSMYSLDTVRNGLNPKSSSSKDNQSSSNTGTSKIRGGLTAARKDAATVTAAKTPTPCAKTRASRRPLMRDPHEGRARPRPPREADIRTMVEAVEPPSSHMSREESPYRAARSLNVTPRSRNVTPRGRNVTPRGLNVTPRGRNEPPRGRNHPSRNQLRALTQPRVNYTAKALRPSPKMVLKASSSINPLGTAESSQIQLKPGSRMQITKTEMPSPRMESPGSARTESPRISPTPMVEKTSCGRQEAEKNRIEMEKAERDKSKPIATNPVMAPGGRCEVTRIVRQLCGGDTIGNRNVRVLGAKNAQLVCVNGSSPRQPSTPQLLRILEETIQKKVPKTLFHKSSPAKNAERFWLTFNIPDRTADSLFLYRTKFVQHMLTSPMYANSSVMKPWEMISSVADQIIDHLLVQCGEEMQLREIVQELYQTET